MGKRADQKPRQEVALAGAPFVVGVGASAGGLAALERLVATTPTDTALAFVVVQHLDPNQKSELPRILARHTQLPVAEVADGARVEAGHVYTMPANKALTIEEGILRLHDRRPGLRFPIDTFLHSLAEDQGERAIAVILTGSGSDGTSGTRAMHEHGGLVVVQDPEEAEVPDMPESVIASGVADLVLAVGDIAARAAEYVEGASRSAVVPQDLGDVLSVLRKQGPPDFFQYRDGTLQRRMQRRMNLRGIEEVDAYVKLLQEEEEEVERLRTDMLLGVTSFFRDPATYKDLEAQVIRPLFARRDAPVRVWIAGCATGEEAYSVAMLLLEEKERHHRDTRIQVFATDINEDAIAAARKGVYAEDALADLSPERRKRFFEQQGAHMFHVKRELRESIAFAAHDLLSDPPLPAMDLVCCRNLLIYLTPEAQRSVLQSFHFALRPGGHLFLGTSENAGRADKRFELVSKAARIYRRTEAPFVPRQVPRPAREPEPERPPRPRHVSEAARAWLLEHYAPPAVAVDAERKVVFIHGDVERFLRLPPGEPDLDVVAMARTDLRPRLRATLHQAERQRTPSHTTVPVGEDVTVDIQVDPIQGTDLLLVTFREAAQAMARPVDGTADDRIVEQLEDELRATKQRLDETVASSEASHEELRATSEEITSMNEELRTTVEELEASKEELQSLNDEMQGVNERLAEESQTAQALADDLSNLFTSTGIPVIFLDRSLRVRRRTPAVDRFFGATSPGTPLTEAKWRFSDDAFVEDAEHVLRDLVPITREVRSDVGHRHRRRILPYRTGDDRIDGVVLVFEDIEALMQVEDELRAAEAYATALVKAVPTPLVVLSDGLVVRSANPAFHGLFGFLPGDAQGRTLDALLGPSWELPSLQDVVEEDEELHDVDVEHVQHGESFFFRLNARRLPSADGQSRILLALHDITNLKQAERDLLSFTSRLHRRIEEQTSMVVEKARLLERVSYTIGHDLREPVRAVESLLTVLEKDHTTDLPEAGQQTVQQARQEIRRLAHLVRGLLDFTRAMQEDVHRVYPVSVRAALASPDCTTRYTELAERRKARVEIVGDDRSVLASVPAMGYILGNLVQNAIEHNPGAAPEVRIHIRRSAEGGVEVMVEDDGPGFPSAVVAGLDEKGVATRGFGLAIAKQMTKFLGGSLRLGTSPLGGGAVHVRLPAAEDEAADPA